MLLTTLVLELHCVNRHLNAPDQQTGQTSAFLEALTLTDDHLIECI